ncbi:MAG: LuxR C-terminal-related transcriptional regulator [Chloroflexi bacterium]|nr:LuxR C-terminal-related transcriptional regulator [Chloroflexota bacterium]
MSDKHKSPPEINDLLQTKFVRPNQNTTVIPRERLLASLDDGQSGKLTLLSAPAGFGKSTLVSQWLASHRDTLLSAWVALDGGDNDPVRFWRYFITACQGGDSTISATALERLTQPPLPNFEAVLTAFINGLSEMTEKRVLVLEDYHHITTPVIHSALAFLIDRLPPSLHLVIISRGECPLPLAKLRMDGELNELSADDLRFSREEIQTFFQHILSLDLKADILAQFHAQTEGWAAGLRLAALTLKDQRGTEDVNSVLAGFSGKHQYLTDYLAEEVLGVLPQDMRDFLLRTSFLSRLTGDLCDAVTGQGDSAAILEDLQHANVFITSLDGRWYRYHALFAEAIQKEALRQLGSTQWQTLHDRASHWYERHGFIAEAAELRLVIKDYEHAAHLITSFIDTSGVYAEYHTLKRWFEELPYDVLENHPILCFTCAMTSLFTGDRRSPATAMFIDKLLRVVEEHWQSENKFEQLGRVYALRAMVAFWQGDLQTAFAAARHAQELLADDDLWWRGISLLQNAFEELLAGRNNAARQYLVEAQVANETVGNQHGASAARLLLGQVYLQRGELRQAREIYEQIYDATATRVDFRDDLAHALTGLATLAYVWNDLEQAQQQASKAIGIAHELGAAELLVPAVLILARVRHARGESVEAQQLLRSTLADVHIPLLWREIQLVQAQLALADGDVEAVQRWHTSKDAESGFIPHTLQEQEALLSARLMIEQSEIDSALRLLKPWQADAHEQQRIRTEIEIIMLRALAYAEQGSPIQARKLLEQALSRAHVENHLRLFLDEGDRLAVLLHETLPGINEQKYAIYARILLVAFAEQAQMEAEHISPDAVALFKPLSEQERRVLRLLAAGLSNPEIAEQFVVSVNTVKTQVQSIYYKLNVSNRQQAAEVARHLNL